MSFITLMKDISAFPDLSFVLHHLDEGHFGVIRPVFCLSSPR
ncbi:hypothetical protein HMPREF3213_02801 [Heyndrickxia coagulans]|uniref:Uncharacterized protein n=1 Tax=Heyndrickxia coagulans TaxID=1398 RepID=A0A133KHS6_HEYCO|nr:hypothetical protein HMPREF3213_02801 [Heyndrickxia coagulans]